MQIYSLTILRAIAIVFVVYSHAAVLGALTIDTLPELVVWNILSGATTMFVFISGFLFHHAFAKRFAFVSFITKKLKNLLVPYIVLSCVALAIGCSDIAMENFEGDFGMLRMGAYMLGSGHATVAYWFIPFALMLFAMSPLHMKFIALKLRTQLIIVGVMFAIALLIHRPVANLGALQNLLYYTPTYLLGIMCSQHRAAADPLLARLTWPLLAAVLVLATCQAMLGVSGNYFKPMFAFGGIDLMLVHTICLCLFLMTILRHLGSWRSRTVELLADTSFAIFFLHPIVMELIEHSPLVSAVSEGESWVRFAVLSGLCVTICAALAWFARRILGPQSHYVTGY